MADTVEPQFNAVEGDMLIESVNRGADAIIALSPVAT
jgi:hypothetical protein